MAQSFFHLAPHNDPLPEPFSEPYSYCNPDNCCDYTDEEHDAIMEQSKPLTDMLFDVIDAYSKVHPELTYEVILHAIDCMAYCINAAIDEVDC